MKTLIAGVGSPILGDDGAGVRIAELLEARPLPPGTDVRVIGTGGLALLDFAAGYDRLVVLDAIVTGAAPGTVHVLRGDDVARALHLGAVGHDADLPTALALGRRLSAAALPDEVVVVAVEVAVDGTDRFSEALSPAVEAALPAAAEVVVRYSLGGGGGGDGSRGPVAGAASPEEEGL